MEQSKIWDHFQSTDSAVDIFQQSLSRYAHLASQTSTGDKVLNIGVGRGGLERLLIQRGVDVYCLDPGERAIAQVRADLDLGEKAQVGWSQSMPFVSEMFDAVIMTEVLEHLSDEVLSATLQEVRRVLKPGGRLIGTVPADENLADGYVLCPHCGENFHRWGHMQSFTHARLQGLLQPVFGKARITRHYFGDWKRLNWKGRITWIIKKLLVALAVRGGVENLFFVAEKLAPQGGPHSAR
jgi:SAM-dependent methyltransferase